MEEIFDSNRVTNIRARQSLKQQTKPEIVGAVWSAAHDGTWACFLPQVQDDVKQPASYSMEMLSSCLKEI
jgi:hypothetical protein